MPVHREADRRVGFLFALLIRLIIPSNVEEDPA